MSMEIPSIHLRHLWQRFQQTLETEAAEQFLSLLLNIMRLMFAINHDYRENIRKFDGRYQFNSKDGKMTVGAIFSDGRLEVEERVIDNPHITVSFRDGRTLFNFLLAPKQDILGSMLRQDVQTDGNLNYLYRFGFLAKRLQLMMTPG
ncbi:hypothetical protein DSCO28_44100 [Desulfosarcina ovata subsp. sediminis]|uniref:SCP2 domain-containing protein n=1 Tax=Desulfosarcina ovata subsp. sediminis TaxID=885957 RepID=A0A5K7ZUJ5_9BACT|nr:hypothetical protein [Desulfosarcina ovata]BBO83844.1 hypothetical protein DSCO28_44100 [Desulfosarcina ovata subsp. sediminis]